MQQAQAAIVLVVLCRLGGAVLFPSSRPSPNSGYPFWFLALTFRSSRPAFCGRLTLPVSPMFYSSAFTFSSGYLLGFCHVPGFAFGRCASFKPFLQAPRRLRGALLFRGLRPSSIWGFPFWLLWLTGQSSRPAFGRRLTFVR